LAAAPPVKKDHRLKLYAPEKFVLSLLGRQKTLWLLRAAFFLAALVTFIAAILPASTMNSIDIIPWDKAEHFIAFFVLTVLAAIAFPRVHVVTLAIALSAFGALIEIVQGLDFVQRDRDFWDWMADTVAIGAAIVAMLVARWRLVFEGS
jgi:VanZ family protein